VDDIVILDDEPDIIESCQRILRVAGYRCVATTDPQAALGSVEAEHTALLLTDLRMPELDGIEVLRRARRIDRHLPVIVMTGFGTIESAVVAVKEGAFDYLAKPFSAEQLQLTVERALTQRRLALENLHLREQLRGTYGFENIVGRSPALQQVLELVRKSARSDANILILGESGTGKELVARAIHANSPRSGQAFVAVDCASLPEHLLESELFGHEKGAFTGAINTKLGLIELANGGTLFLDELAELPSNLQVKLLRVVQERQLRRVGGTRQINLDLRLVSATNRDLRKVVAGGKFREDLYYRIAVIDITLPLLRERHGDVTLLAYAFLNKFERRDTAPLQGFQPEVLEALEAYSWPGNVRELQNVIQRACALADSDKIGLSDLSRDLRLAAQTHNSASPPSTAGRLPLKQEKARWIEQLESAYITELLERKGGNISEAARAAEVDRKTIHRLLNKHRLR
jgi:DNA-binding NtrC family response regulator